jgi:hypothetical protein
MTEDCILEPAKRLPAGDVVHESGTNLS